MKNRLSKTYRYHAHSEVLRGDGLYGGLVVHDPSSQEQVTYQYDKELLFLVGDWYHRPAQEVLDAFMSPLATGNEVCLQEHLPYRLVQLILLAESLLPHHQWIRPFSVF